MSKVGNWILGMEEDATVMDRFTFIKTHGEAQVDIWDRVNGPEEDVYDCEPELNIPEDLPCEKIFF